MTLLLKNTYLFIISNKISNLVFKINLITCIRVAVTERNRKFNIVGAKYFRTLTNTAGVIY